MSLTPRVIPIRAADPSPGAARTVNATPLFRPLLTLAAYAAALALYRRSAHHLLCLPVPTGTALVVAGDGSVRGPGDERQRGGDGADGGGAGAVALTRPLSARFPCRHGEGERQPISPVH